MTARKANMLNDSDKIVSTVEEESDLSHNKHETESNSSDSRAGMMVQVNQVATSGS
jgi:hypothetical protein